MKLSVQPGPGPHGEIKVNGDKSITHRGLLIGAIAEGTTTIHGFSTSRDCQSTRQALTGLGVTIEQEGPALKIQGRGRFGLAEPADVLDCGNSGTTIRLLAGLLAGQSFMSVLTGDDSLRRRPMGRLIKPLHEMGAQVQGRGRDRFAPLCISGRRLKGGSYSTRVASAQVKSAVLLAGLHARSAVTVEEPTPTRDHTERMLDHFGVPVTRTGRCVTLAPPDRITAHPLLVPGDISSAAFFMIWALTGPAGRLCIRNVGLNPCRSGLVKALALMGARLEITDQHLSCNEPFADIIVEHSQCRGIDVPGASIPGLIDELPALAVAATQATGITRVRGAGELRVKECDRIKAIVTELAKMGARITEQEDGFTVEGPVALHGAEVDSHGDHRIAMALVIAGLIARGETVVREADCIAISFPEFTEIARSLGAQCRNI